MKQAYATHSERGNCISAADSASFKLSNDPLFVDKVRDIVGLYLYLSPPTALGVERQRGGEIAAIAVSGPVHRFGQESTMLETTFLVVLTVLAIGAVFVLMIYPSGYPRAQI